jgi:hypothetical protein
MSFSWVLTGIARDEKPLPPSSLQHQLFQLLAISQWAAQNYRVSDEGKMMGRAIQDGACIGVSDGSFKEEWGSPSWVLEGSTPASRIRGYCATLGLASGQNAYTGANCPGCLPSPLWSRHYVPDTRSPPAQWNLDVTDLAP